MSNQNRQPSTFARETAEEIIDYIDKCDVGVDDATHKEALSRIIQNLLDRVDVYTRAIKRD